jgi:hypothetical protein
MVLRFATAQALALAAAYGLGFPLPFLAPLFVTFLGVAPGPPPGMKALLGILLVAVLSLSVGLLLIPLLRYYPFTAILFVALGLHLSMYLTLSAGKRLLGTFLTVGFTLISAAGSVDFSLARAVIAALALAIALAVLCLWLAFALFPGGAPGRAAETPVAADESSWQALRATLIVMPAYLLALTNPSQYLMTIMKSVSLGQQATVVDARHAGRELLGSTFVGGLMATLFWALLSLAPTLWMYTLWMFAFALFCAAKLFALLRSRVAPSFWINALVTLLILLGPAVEDSASGKDALAAFAVRFATFVGVTLYAWAALVLLENWRARRLRHAVPGSAAPG